MKRYVVSYEEYWSGLENGAVQQDRYFFPVCRAFVEKPIGQLIDKYAIRGKRILSIGSWTGHEEYWFWKAGNQLVLADLDGGNVIEAYLQSLPEKKDDGLVYIIGDAFGLAREQAGVCDICYLSSFEPDERYRGTIVAGNNRRPGRLLLRAVDKTARAMHIPLRVARRTWPDTADPFSDEVIALAGRFLTDGGLFISQSYASPIDITRNRHMIALAARQLRRHGMELLRMYHLDRYPWVTLTIGYRGTAGDARTYMEAIAANPDIDTFHGRHAMDGDMQDVHAKVAFSLV